MVPPQHLRGTTDIHSRVQHHLAPRHVSQELDGVVSELHAVEPSREAEQLARLRTLGAGLDLGGAQQGAVVEDGHGGGGVVDGHDVGVGDVDGEDELDVEDWEVELE